MCDWNARIETCNKPMLYDSSRPTQTLQENGKVKAMLNRSFAREVLCFPGDKISILAFVDDFPSNL